MKHLIRLLVVLQISVLAGGCASTAPARRDAVQLTDEGGFVITEEVQADESARAQFDAAIAALRSGDNTRGTKLLEDLAQRVPGATAVHINLGIAYSRTGNLDGAEASLGRALALNPRHPVALNEQGRVFRRTGRFAEARRSYEQALAVYPDFHFARRNLAVLCDLYLGDTRCALENYERYSEAVPSDEEAAMWMADLRNRTGN